MCRHMSYLGKARIATDGLLITSEQGCCSWCNNVPVSTGAFFAPHTGLINR